MANLKFLSTKHPLFSLAIIVCLILLAGGIVIAAMTFGIVGKIIMIIIDLLLICMFVWVYISTYYELRDDEIYIHSGPFEEHIKYDSITDIKKTRGYSIMYALAFDRIEIKHKVDGITERTYISPVDEDEFLRKLDLKRM